MAINPSEIANSLSERYKILHDAFTDLTIDAAHYQNASQTQETAPRDISTGLTRILAFCDHVHVALNLMGEEVRALDEACHASVSEPAIASRSDQLRVATP